MKILVVGGAGYIGSHTVYELIRAGHEVVVLDNLATGRRDAVHPDARFYWGDIRNGRDITRVFDIESSAEFKNKPIEVVMHFAAKLIVPESVSQPLAYYENNVEGVRTLLEAMVDRDIKRLVFSSTAAVYGELEGGICREDDLTCPINPYGETKLACEKMIQWVSAAHDMQYCIFRYFNVAGADASLAIGLDKDNLTHIIPLVMQTALGLRDKFYIFGSDYDTPDGTCVRDYIHVTDLAQAHVLGADYLLKTSDSLIANLGSGDGYSVKQVLDAAQGLFEVPFEYAPRRPGDPARLIANTTRVHEMLGWHPQLSLTDILKSDYDFRRKLMQKEV
ncbi:MAG: UDP-glucose 4-epimerase GalE [Coriobacteriales bacterium]|nr:UDP-glucose 4-epimerase GalE [Coriobacteriales bacterium]